MTTVYSKNPAPSSPLWAITTICRYSPNSYREQNYFKIRKRLLRQNIPLLTVEIAYEKTPFFLSHKDADILIQLKTSSPVWHKEKAFNIGSNYIPENTKALAFIDADIMFDNPTWHQTALNCLNQCPIIQPFRRATCLNQDEISYSWIMSYTYKQELEKKSVPLHPLSSNCPGMAWIINLPLLNKTSGLYDKEIVGGADRMLADAITHPTEIYHSGNSSYQTKEMLDDYYQWKSNFTKYIHSPISLPEPITHLWHDKPRYRMYTCRHAIALKHNFNPKTDLTIEPKSNLYQISSTKPKLLEDLTTYTLMRETLKNTPESVRLFTNYHQELNKIWLEKLREITP